MTLYVDIMLDFYQMRDADDEGRRQHIASRIGQGLPPILKKYALRDFDEATFLRDFRAWLGECGQPKDT